MSDTYFARIIASFEDRPWPFGLSAAKLRNRAYVVDPVPEGDTDPIVFELERHRGLMGERYVPGAPMRNFATELRRYAFLPDSETIEERHREVVDVDLDAAGVVDTLTEFGVSFSIEATADGYRVLEVATGRETTVESETECCQWARELATEWALSPIVAEVRPHIDDAEWHAFRDRVESGLQAALEGQASRAWARHVTRSA